MKHYATYLTKPALLLVLLLRGNPTAGITGPCIKGTLPSHHHSHVLQSLGFSSRVGWSSHYSWENGRPERLGKPSTTNSWSDITAPTRDGTQDSNARVFRFDKSGVTGVLNQGDAWRTPESSQALPEHAPSIQSHPSPANSAPLTSHIQPPFSNYRN